MARDAVKSVGHVVKVPCRGGPHGDSEFAVWSWGHAPGRSPAKEWGMSDRSGTNADEMPPEFRVRQWPLTTIPEGHPF